LGSSAVCNWVAQQQSPENAGIAEHQQALATLAPAINAGVKDYYHSLHICPRNYLGGVVAKFIFGGKEITGDGTPEGLPLNCRFSHLRVVIYRKHGNSTGKMVGSTL